MTATYSLTLPAARVVVLNARDADDARELLAMWQAASPDKLVTPTALRLVTS